MGEIYHGCYLQSTQTDIYHNIILINALLSIFIFK